LVTAARIASMSGFTGSRNPHKPMMAGRATANNLISLTFMSAKIQKYFEISTH
jgi:hypothetical protein